MAITDEQLKQTIDSIISDYKTKGSIGSDALCDRLDKIDADANQIDEIYKALEENNIKIIDDYEKTRTYTNRLSKR